MNPRTPFKKFNISMTQIPFLWFVGNVLGAEIKRNEPENINLIYQNQKCNINKQGTFSK